MIIVFTGPSLIIPDGTPPALPPEAEEYRGKPIILPPDRIIRFSHRHGGFTFAPVIYKNELKGFRIVRNFEDFSSNRDLVNKVRYVALGDSPMEVGEEDVAMVMEEGRVWKTREEAEPVKERVTGEEIIAELRKRREQANAEYARNMATNAAATASEAVAREEAVPPSPPTVADEDGTTRDGQGDEATAPRRTWGYIVAIAAICVGVALYFMGKGRRK